MQSLVDEEEVSLPGDGELIPCKRRSVDIGDGVVRAVDSVVGDFMQREMETIVMEDVFGPVSNIPRSAEVDEGMSLPSVMTEAKWPSTVTFDTSWQEGPSSSRPSDEDSLLADG